MSSGHIRLFDPGGLSHHLTVSDELVVHCISFSMSDDDWLVELRKHLVDMPKTSNIKPLLDAVNELANEHQIDAKIIVNEICQAIAREARSDKRLAYFYLFDTLSKNRRIFSMFRPLIAGAIELPFVKSYQHMNSSTRELMDKTLRAWKSNKIFDDSLLDSIRAQCDNPSLIKPSGHANKSSHKSVSFARSSQSAHNNTSRQSETNDPRRRTVPTHEHHDAKVSTILFISPDSRKRCTYVI